MNQGVRIYQSIIQYRNVQLLGKLFNEVLQRVVVTILIVQTLLGQAIFSALLISLHNTPTANLFEMGVIGLMQMNTFAAIVILIGGLGQVYVTSADVNWACVKHTANNKISSRYKRNADMKFLRSCSDVRVCFGELNYIDRLTPLNCIDFSNNLAVQFLLLKRS